MPIIVINPPAVSGVTGNSGIATLDFGTPPADTLTSVAVTGQTGILTTSKIFITKRIEATSNHSADETRVENWEPVVGNIVAGVGFTIYGKCLVGRTNGRFNVSWEWV